MEAHGESTSTALYNTIGNIAAQRNSGGCCGWASLVAEMQLSQPFMRLALAVDADHLRTEIGQFGSGDWRAHPQGHPGNTALPLVARRGQPQDDGVAGPMRATPHLARCPYVRQVLAALGAPLGRSRLMRLDAGAEATAHVDTNYYWMQRVRVHIPIVTTPGVRFLCGSEETHMAPGEVWIFDTWRPHNVLNPPGFERIHLVVDTVGSEAFWALARDARDGPKRVDYDPGSDPLLVLETVNFPVVMSPYEFDALWSNWRADAFAAIADADPVPIEALDAEVRGIRREWRATWAAHGDTREGWPAYVALLDSLHAIAKRHQGAVRLANQQDLANLIQISLIPALHSPDLEIGGASKTAVPDLGQQRIVKNAAAAMPVSVAAPIALAAPDPARPLIVVCAPRSGSTLLFERLAACSPDWFTVGNESHLQIEGIAALRPAERGFDSNVLAASDATADVAAELRVRFAAAVRDREGRPLPADGNAWQFLEKTPKNALRVPFLLEVFPDARFLYLWREPEESLASLIEGWQSRRFIMHPDLPDWPGPPWSYLLVPGWRELAGRPLPDIVAAQWRITQERLLNDLERLPSDRVRALNFRDFLADPEGSLRAICEFANVTFDRSPPRELPFSAHTVTPPGPDKWRRHESALAPMLPTLAPIAQRARHFVAARALAGSGTPSAIQLHPQPEPAMPDPVATVPEESAAAAPPLSASAANQLASVHTSNLPGILKQLHASLLITTYQTGHVIVARPDGHTLNTHFAAMRKPMGVATDGQRLVVGVETGVREYRNVPDLSARLDPPGRHDAVYALRNHHITGDIDIHEIALTGSECWYVNTLFSCLCTLDHDHSFVPRWRPRFITSLAPEDRCHLNGMAVIDGTPKYLTALGATDTPQGWRSNKRNGGVLLDYASREVIASGLSMPHSPRWHNGRLWLLESGRGGLATVDLATGKTETVARVPGFTRGLDLIGNVAFIGLSQLRETNAFTDIPITEANRDRMSGVWIVNLETGETVAFLKFSQLVQEIFGVVLLRGAVFPTVVDDGDDLLKTTYVLPDEALKEVRFAPPSTTTTDLSRAHQEGPQPRLPD